jgi:hypothetical protein
VSPSEPVPVHLTAELTLDDGSVVYVQQDILVEHHPVGQPGRMNVLVPCKAVPAGRLIARSVIACGDGRESPWVFSPPMSVPASWLLRVPFEPVVPAGTRTPVGPPAFSMGGEVSLTDEQVADFRKAFDAVAATPPVIMPSEPLVRIRLVPVEVFGADTEDCEGCGETVRCGYGLMDAVSAYSDCNRAIGRIYRVDEETSEAWREPGDTITVYVPQSEMAKFQRRYGDNVDGDWDRCPACHVPYSKLPDNHELSRPVCTGSANSPADNSAYATVTPGEFAEFTRRHGVRWEET